MPGQRSGKLGLAWVAAHAAEIREAIGVTPGAGTLVSLAMGDGENLEFDFATSGVACSMVVVDGVIQPGTIWSVSAGTGEDGHDQLVFGAGNAPGTGAAVEALIST